MRRALGKGLSQLIGEQQAERAPAEVPIDSIVPNQRQPRTVFNDQSLEELAASIREVGLIQPLVVRAVSEGRYELIAGERRLRAAKLAGLKSIPVVVRAAGGETALSLALVENIQREGISAIECARAYKRLIDEFGLTQEKIAEKVGKSRVAVSNTVRLLKLPVEVQQGLEIGLISEGHARALLMFDTHREQSAMFHKIVRKGLSVRDVEAAARPKESAPKEPVRKPASTAKPTDPNLRGLEDGLSVFFGSPVHIEPTAVGGRIVLDYYSDDDLQRILDILGIHL